MSKLAKKIAASAPPKAIPAQRGPANACYPIYGAGDLEDWEALEVLRKQGPRVLEWREVQIHVDQLAGITKPLPLAKFKYHWRRMCYCWPEELRLR